MKYVRTKDGKIADLEKFINEEKDTPYYKDFEFEEISKDGELKWTAIGTEKCSLKDQIGTRCHFSATLNSEVIKTADTIEELCDEFVIIRRDDNTFALAKYYPNDKTFYVKTADEEVSLSECLMYGYEIYGAIWTSKGLIYVAKMNEKGELELL